MVTSASGEGDAPPRPDPVVVDIDPMSAVVFACVAVIALASWAIVTTAPDMVTRLAVGIVVGVALSPLVAGVRSEEHTSELQSLMRISYAVFCLKKKKSRRRKQKNSPANSKH